VCGITPIRKQWQVPAMIMDATLPKLPIPQAYFPQLQPDDIDYLTACRRMLSSNRR